MAGTHSRLSASGAPAYSLCLGKPNAEAGLPDVTSFFAAEGTVFHEIAARCAELGFEPEDFLGEHFVEDGYEFVWTEEFCRHMHDGLDRIRELAGGAHLVVEERVDLSMILGAGEAGTLDIGIVDVGRREITIFDWKYGQGVPVAPAYPIFDPISGEETGIELNRQLVLYCIGFWEMWAVWMLGDMENVKVRLIIEQPRAEGGGGEYLTTMEEVFEVGEDLRIVAEKTRDPDAPRTPGERQCQFCKARATPGGCYAYNAYVFDLLGLEFTEMDVDIRLGAILEPPDPRLLTPDRRAYIQRHTALIEKFMKDNHKLVLEDALRGLPTPGVKAVAGRNPPRKWRAGQEDNAKAAVVKLLGKDAWKTELLSPTQVEERVTELAYANEIAKYVDLGTPKVTLAPTSSKKPALENFQDMLSETDVEVME